MRFLLGARGGQKMNVVVQSLENNAIFEVVGDGGSLGTYAIIVSSTRGGSEFNLYVEIR